MIETMKCDQNILLPLFKHELNEIAFNFVCGYFGIVKNRELICVQCFNGILKFYDQESAIFTCVLSDLSIPSPFCYSRNADTFVLVKSNWIMEGFNFRQLSDFESANTRVSLNENSRKLLPEWSFNMGEEIFSLQVVQTSNDSSSIIALGERLMYCIQDNGVPKWMKKFDFIPVCLHAYLVGWFYEPNARLLIAVVSGESKLFIYENTKLLWSCALDSQAIMISRGYFKGLPGGLVTIDVDGAVSCFYLGTEPDLATVPAIQESKSYDEVQRDLKVVEAELDKYSDVSEDKATLENDITIAIHIKECLRKRSMELSVEDMHLQDMLLCPVSVILTAKIGCEVQSIHISFSCHHPFSCSEVSKVFETFDDSVSIEVYFYVVDNESIPSNTEIGLHIVLTDKKEKMYVITKKELLPLTLFCIPTKPEKESKCKVTLITNLPQVDLMELYSDFDSTELTKVGATSNALALSLMSSNITIICGKASQRYRIQSDKYCSLTVIMNDLITRLRRYFALKSQVVNVNFGGSLTIDMMQSFTHVIEIHADERIKLQNLKDQMDILLRQFTLIQKRLLVQYGSLPPGNCDKLEFLIKDTNTRITYFAKSMIRQKQVILRCSCELAANANMVLLVMETLNTPTSLLSDFKEALAIDNLYNIEEEWEEQLSQSIQHIIRMNSDKEKDKLAPLTEHGILKGENIKRLVKHIRIVLDQLLSEIKQNSNVT